MYFELPETNIRIIGSMHRFPADTASLPDWITAAYEWSEDLIFEADNTHFLKYMHQSTGSKLQKQLTPETWAHLTELWPDHLPSLDLIRPWAVLLIAPALTFASVEGVEDALLKRAADESKEIRYLETMEAFAAGCDLAPIDDVIQGIELLFSDLTVPKRGLEAIHGAWVRRDLRGVYEAAAESLMFKNPSFRDVMLRNRNQAWASNLATLFGTPKRTLVVVGALHLHGPENFLSLLRTDTRSLG